MKESIGWIVLFIIFGVCFTFAQNIIFSLINGNKKEYYPYHSKFILTNVEYKFYVAVKPLLDAKGYILCPKVGLKDLFEVNKGTKERQRYFNKISQKHIDFLVCDSNLRPVFAIELDDKSHKKADVKERDKFKDGLFQAADMILYRVPTAASYPEEYITAHVKHLQDTPMDHAVSE